jgi:hypothetical protein
MSNEQNEVEVPAPIAEPLVKPIPADATLTGKLNAYNAAIPVIFNKGTDAEVAQISKRIDELGKLVEMLRSTHDACFDQIALGTFDVKTRGERVKRIFKVRVNAKAKQVAEVVENDPLKGEF